MRYFIVIVPLCLLAGMPWIGGAVDTIAEAISGASIDINTDGSPEAVFVDAIDPTAPTETETLTVSPDVQALIIDGLAAHIAVPLDDETVPHSVPRLEAAVEELALEAPEEEP